MCGWRDAEQFGAARGSSAAGPTDRRPDSSSRYLGRLCFVDPLWSFWALNDLVI
jgi:hypothetical protein